MLKCFSPGEVFWYNSKKTKYGAIVLFVIEKPGLYLIAISEAIKSNNKTPTIEEILLSEVYTIAWFGEVFLLPLIRAHRIGVINIHGDYLNRVGIKFLENGSFEVNNVGQTKTWKHTFRSYVIKNCKMHETLKASLFPKTWAEGLTNGFS